MGIICLEQYSTHTDTFRRLQGAQSTPVVAEPSTPEEVEVAPEPVVPSATTTTNEVEEEESEAESEPVSPGSSPISFE